MSRRKREAAVAQAAAITLIAENGAPMWKKFIGAKHIGVAAAVLLILGFAVLGALSEKYKHSFASGNKASTNAAVTEPLSAQANTPQLSKEYIYAGGRMLAVEDANTQSTGSSGISGMAIYGTSPASGSPKVVPRVLMTATSVTPGAMQSSSTTDSSGFYQLQNLTQGADYKITPTKAAYQDFNGVTPFDATLVLREVAAGSGILTANQRIAADANNSGSITPFDATLILRYVAANSFTSGTGQIGHWKFVPESKSYSSFSGARSSENYDAVLVGDVNGSWAPPAAISAIQVENPYPIYIYPGYGTAPYASTVVIPIFFSNNSYRAVRTFSLQFRFDPALLGPISPVVSTSGTLSAGCEILTNTATYGMIGVTATCPSPISASSGTLLNFTLETSGGDSPRPYTTLWFNYSSNVTPLFEDPEGNRIGVDIGYASFEIEAPAEFANNSRSSKGNEDLSATLAGSDGAFAPSAGLQQQQLETEEMQISLPENAAAARGSTLLIPIALKNNAGAQLSAFSFDVQFNPGLLRSSAGAAIETAGTLSSNCEVIAQVVTGGKINIAGACDEDITAAAGTLVKLRFIVAGRPNNSRQEARVLQFRQIPLFENRQGKRIAVGRSNGSIR